MPKRPALEIADIVRAHGEAFRKTHALSAEQHAVLRAVERCRTASLGGHLDVCTQCGHNAPSYNSCRNRHCPKCQSISQARWIEGRIERLLPIPYFHVVFTLPSELRGLAAYNRALIFDMLFAAASATLLELGRDPKRLGAELGITMVLHTWTRDLRFHPHVHSIVTGGGLSLDGSTWIAAKENHLFPVHVMGALFRGKFLDALEHAHIRGELVIPPTSKLADPAGWNRFRDQLYRTRWVVYAKRPFGGAEQVIRYLGRYTHRVGISNQRLVRMDEQGVTFRTKDGKAVTVHAEQFLRRFVQHVLPKGLVKIRHYGLMASSHATTRLEIARQRLQTTVQPPKPVPSKNASRSFETIMLELTGIDVRSCPICKQPSLIRQPLARAPPWEDGS